MLETPHHADGADETARARGSSALLAAALVAYGIVGSDFSYDDVKRALRGQVTKDPLDATFSLVLVGGVLFYLAEHGKNDEVTTLWDAVSYVATSLNVGYHYVHPVTPAGKALCAWVQSVGPALAARTLDAPVETPVPAGHPHPGAAPADAAADPLEIQRQILAKLEAIHRELVRERPRD